MTIRKSYSELSSTCCDSDEHRSLDHRLIGAASLRERREVQAARPASARIGLDIASERKTMLRQVMVLRSTV
jgi:hypothetical protein